MTHKNKKIKIPSSILDIKKLHRKNLSHDTALAETKIFSPGNSNLELERRAFPRKLTVTLRRRGRSRTQQNLYGIRYIPTWRGTAGTPTAGCYHS